MDNTQISCVLKTNIPMLTATHLFHLCIRYNGGRDEIRNQFLCICVCHSPRCSMNFNINHSQTFPEARKPMEAKKKPFCQISRITRMTTHSLGQSSKLIFVDNGEIANLRAMCLCKAFKCAAVRRNLYICASCRYDVKKGTTHIE